jgi:exopolysaccharide production protein ExoQ
MRTLELRSELTSRQFADAILAQKRYTFIDFVNVFILSVFGMDGVWGIAPAQLTEFAQRYSIVLFWICSLGAFISVRGRVPWHLLTCRFAFVFLCWNILSVAWSSQPLSTTYSPALSAICVFCYYCYIMDRFTLSEFKTLLFQMYTALFILSFVQIARGHGREILSEGASADNIGAWKGVFRQKNDLGVNCGVAFGLCLGYLPKNLLEHIWRAFLMGLALVLAYKSGSRSGWAAIAVIIFLAFIVKQLRRLQPTSRLPALIAVFVFVIAVIALVYFNLDAILALMGRDRTLTGRASIWDWALMAAKRHPLIGYGIYGYWSTPLSWEVVVRAGWNVTSSHNSFLDVIITYGLIGLALYLPIPLSAIIFTFRAILNYSLETYEMYIYMIVVIIFMSFGSTFLTYTPGIAFVLVLYAVSNLEKVERSGFMTLDNP